MLIAPFGGKYPKKTTRPLAPNSPGKTVNCQPINQRDYSAKQRNNESRKTNKQSNKNKNKRTSKQTDKQVIKKNR